MGFCLFVVKRPTNTLWINKNTTSFHATKQIYLTMMSIFMYYFNISKRPKNLRSSSSLESTSTDSQIWRKQTTIFCTRAQLTGFRPMLHNPEQRQAHPKLSWSGSLHIFLLHWSTELRDHTFAVMPKEVLNPTLWPCFSFLKDMVQM